MSAKYSFQLRSSTGRQDFPHKIILGQREIETPVQVLLKLLGYLLFFRERLQIEPRLDLDTIPFVPDLVELDYGLRPVLWVECGECTVTKLDRLAVKVPDAALWVLKRSPADAELLWQLMAKHELRRRRYRLIGFDAEMFDEVLATLQARNEVLWVRGSFDPAELQFDFNGLWFEASYQILEF